MPYAGNEEALGWDLGSNQARLAMLNLARDTGKVEAAGRVILVRDNLSEPSFLVVLPVYLKGMPVDTIAAGRWLSFEQSHYSRCGRDVPRLS